MSTLKQRFELLRTLCPDITNADLARAAGVKPPSVTDWFSGKTKSLKGTPAAKVAALYGADVVWLSTGEGRPPTKKEAEQARQKLKDSATPAPQGDQPNSPIPPWLQGDTTLARAPVVRWAELGAELFKEAKDLAVSEWAEFVPTTKPSDLCKLVVVEDDSLAPRIARGDMVAIDPRNIEPTRGQVTLFRAKSDGSYLLRRFRPVAGDAFEAVDAAGAALDSVRHTLEIVGVACGVKLHDI